MGVGLTLLRRNTSIVLPVRFVRLPPATPCAENGECRDPLFEEVCYSRL
jgi:hypothetical protein